MVWNCKEDKYVLIDRHHVAVVLVVVEVGVDMVVDEGGEVPVVLVTPSNVENANVVILGKNYKQLDTLIFHSIYP